jgi:hypothetical protein
MITQKGYIQSALRSCVSTLDTGLHNSIKYVKDILK